MAFSSKLGFFEDTSGSLGSFTFPTWPTVPTEAEYTTEVGSWTNTATPTIHKTPVGWNNNHRGCIAHPNGNIYMIPYWKDFFVEVDPSSNVFTRKTSHSNLGSVIIDFYETAKQSGGSLASNGNIYLAPYLDGQPVIEYDPINDVASNLSLTGMPTSTYSYYGAVTLPSGNIVFQPRLSGNPYLKYEPGSNTIIKLSETPANNGAHSGGCVGFDGNYYVSPSFSNQVRKYNESSNTWTNVGSTLSGSANMYTGLANGKNGVIIGVPQSQNTFLRIDTIANTTQEISITGYNQTSGTQFIGAVTGSDGRVYGVPAISANLLIIDSTDSSTDVIDANKFGVGNFAGGGSTTDGYIFCAGTGNQIYRIDTKFRAQNNYSGYDNKSTANTIFSAHISHALNKGP